MARPDELYEGESPFLLEALETDPAGELDEALIAPFARMARRVSRRRRHHVERALERHLADRGHGSADTALAALRGRMSELDEAEDAGEAMEHEASGCPGGAACRGHEPEVSEECGGTETETEWEARDDSELDEAEADSFESEAPEALFESDELEDESDLEVPFRDELEDEALFAEALEPMSTEELAGLNRLYEALVDVEPEEEMEEDFEDSELEGDVEMEGEAPSLAEIKSCLDAVTVVRTRQVSFPEAPNPFDLNAIASRNSPEKRGMFKPLQSTWSSLRSVDAAIAKAKTPSAKLKAKRAALLRRRDDQAAALKAWVRKHPLDHSRKRTQLRKEITALEGRLKKLKGQAYSAAHADLDARKSALGALEKALQTAALAYEPLKDVVQSHHEVRVPGRSGAVDVRLHDHVIAFATDTAGGFEGHAVADSSSAVPDALRRSGLSASKQSMLRVLSSLEGYFSSVNTWDRAVITFGFIQWTTDEAAEGTLCKLMGEIRSLAPDTYKRCFQCHGLDLQGKYFKVTLADGTSLVGPAAARHVQTSLKHVAALSAAGMDPDVQAAQVRFAAETKIDGMLARKLSARGKSVKLGELLTSDYAVAVTMDRATGTGEPGTHAKAQKAFAAFVKAHPDADLATSADRAAAGAAVLAGIEGLDRERAGKYAALSHDAGSFSA